MSTKHTAVQDDNPITAAEADFLSVQPNNNERESH